MKVHVICCNDSVEFAVVGDEEKAKAKMAELSAKFFERCKWKFEDDAEYQRLVHWHIQTVNGA